MIVAVRPCQRLHRADRGTRASHRLETSRRVLHSGTGAPVSRHASAICGSSLSKRLPMPKARERCRDGWSRAPIKVCWAPLPTDVPCVSRASPCGKFATAGSRTTGSSAAPGSFINHCSRPLRRRRRAPWNGRPGCCATACGTLRSRWQQCSPAQRCADASGATKRRLFRPTKSSTHPRARRPRQSDDPWQQRAAAH